MHQGWKVLMLGWTSGLFLMTGLVLAVRGDWVSALLFTSLWALAFFVGGRTAENLVEGL